MKLPRQKYLYAGPGLWLINQPSSALHTDLPTLNAPPPAPPTFRFSTSPDPWGP